MADMTIKIPFLTHVRFYSVESDRVEDRLRSHLKHLQSAKFNQFEIELNSEDQAKIRRRAQIILNLRKNYVSARNLKAEDRSRLKVVSTGVTLEGPTTEDEVDFLGATLHDEMPWMQPVTEKIWRDMRNHIQSGGSGVKFMPTLVFGPPGMGVS